jgi:excisionase family DNA binding protein
MARMEPTKESVLAAHGDYFTVKEAARLLRMTEAHLRTEIRWGQISAVRRGRLLLIRPEAVAAQFSDAADAALLAIAPALAAAPLPTAVSPRGRSAGSGSNTAGRGAVRRSGKPGTARAG